VRLSQCDILDTWYTTGLRGTGSNDLRVADVFVEAERTFSFQDAALIKRPGPLYAFPFMFAAKGPAPALGIARHAIDALIDITCSKPARRYTRGEHVEPPKMMRDDVFVQEAVGRAETMLGSGPGISIRDYWGSLEDLGQRRRGDACTDRPLHDGLYPRYRRVCGRGAACLQGGGWHRSL
jgi:hypothetical protein